MRALAGLLCGLLGLVPGAAAYEPDVFGTAGQVAGQAVYDLGGSGLPCRGGPPPTELSLEEAIERILCHDPQTRLAWANAKAQAAQVGIGKSAYLPRLDGRLDASRGYSDMDYRDAPYLSGDGHRHRRGASLQLSWVLFDFGRRSAALRNAQQLLLAANASQDATLQNTFALAAQAYYDALAAQRSLAASRQVAELAAQNLEAADAKYRAGAAALSDRLQAQTALSQASLAQVRDEGALSNALGVIALRMGLAPDTPLRLSGELEAQSDTGFVKAIDEMLAEARREHPALLAAQARLKAAAASVEESRAAGRPSLALSANLARSHSDQAMAFNGDTRERDRSIGLQLNIPLFEGFERTYQVRNALARREASEAELADTEQQVSLEVWNNYQSLSVETRSLARTRELVEQSRQSLEVVQGRYRSGVGSMIELLNALTAYASAEDQHIRALGNWQTSRLRLGRHGHGALRRPEAAGDAGPGAVQEAAHPVPRRSHQPPRRTLRTAGQRRHSRAAHHPHHGRPSARDHRLGGPRDSPRPGQGKPRRKHRAPGRTPGRRGAGAGLMRALAGLLCGLLGLVPGAAAYEPDVFGTAGQVAGQAVYDLGGSGLPCRGGPPPTELSLEEAIERILCHDPQTRLAWANAKAQAAQVGIGKSAYLPRLDGRLDASRGYSDMDYRDAPYLSGDGHRHRRGASLQLSWVLFDFGRRSAALRNAQQLLLAANASQDATLQNTFALAAQAYYDALAAQRSLAASRQVAELAAQNLEAADAKYRAGAAALSDRLQAQTALSQASLAQVRDEGALSNALGVIALRMGLAPDTPLRLSGELEAQSDTGFVKAIDEMLAEARREHPALLAAQARLKAAAASVEESRAAGRPSLALSANLARSHSDQAMAFNGDTRERDRSIGLQLNIPLFEGFERTYQVRNALARREASEAELADTEQQVSLEVWNNYQSLSVETRSLARTRELVEQSRQSLEVVQGRYRSGVGSMIELLNALTAYASAEDQHIRALGNWQTSRLRLAASLGRLGLQMI
ncbi:outer membrane protein [Pseudomonas aeruginosa BWHPSA017]|nr:outer membrane protein [Pseudomonas aeruginosa BWHPSA017]